MRDSAHEREEESRPLLWSPLKTGSDGQAPKGCFRHDVCLECIVGSWLGLPKGHPKGEALGEKRPSREVAPGASLGPDSSTLLAQLVVLRAPQDGLHDAGPEEAVADSARRLLPGHSQEAGTR